MEIWIYIKSKLSLIGIFLIEASTFATLYLLMILIGWCDWCAPTNTLTMCCERLLWYKKFPKVLNVETELFFQIINFVWSPESHFTQNGLYPKWLLKDDVNSYNFPLVLFQLNSVHTMSQKKLYFTSREMEILLRNWNSIK